MLNFLYNYSPYTIKTFLASTYGYYLKLLRHSGDFHRYIDEALERENWSVKDWQVWQENRLEYYLYIAYKYVPYYRNYWKNNDRNRTGLYKDINNWPIIDKKIIQKYSQLFINDQYKYKPLFKEYTSGSTGTPIKMFHSINSLRYWYALSEVRWRDWYGLSYKRPWAYLAGRKVVSSNTTNPPFWVWNKGLNQLYLSCYHLQSTNAALYLKAMEDCRVEYLYGLASSINEIAYYGVKFDISPPVLKGVVTCAEILYPHHKKNIENYFSCPVYNSYGSTEKVIAASECKFNKMHIWSDAGISEVLPINSDDSVEVGGTGNLICTGLVNDSMPLIRYDLGDVGSIDNNLSCKCGRSLPIMTSIEGRSDDMIVSPDGRRVMVIWSFLQNMPIFELQLIQNNLSKIDINYVAENKLSVNNKALISTLLKNNLGNFQFAFNRVNSIKKNKNGKFKAVISKI